MSAIKIRRKTKMFMKGSLVKSYFCFEILNQGKWLLAGDDNGIFKFESEDGRENKIKELLGEN